MIYPYHRVHRPGASRLIPIVPITLLHGDASVFVTALVDSGAEHSIFGSELADALELTIEDETRVLVAGFDGREADRF